MTTWTRTVESGEVGERLDRWLSARFADLSRTRIKALVDEGQVRVGGDRSKAAYRLKAGDEVVVELPPAPTEDLEPEPIPLDVVFEDDHVLVVDKPAGMVTHPGAGRRTGTLAAAALAHTPSVAGVGGPRRPGIVHRLDKGTSGLIVLAKTSRAYDRLTAQLARREVSRRYLCLAHGRLRRSAGRVDVPIGRDPRSRVRMAVARDGRGRRAVTRFLVLERPGDFSYVECRLETGRTHQIRVHLSSLGHPIVGDTTYGAPRSGLPAELVAGLHGVALHAAGLGFVHPETGERVELESPLPHRIGSLLSYLRHITDRPAGLPRPKGP
jgi:23S rRNA pseudouridine1911/1915/1917 synthase